MFELYGPNFSSSHKYLLVSESPPLKKKKHYRLTGKAHLGAVLGPLARGPKVADLDDLILTDQHAKRDKYNIKI